MWLDFMYLFIYLFLLLADTDTIWKRKASFSIFLLIPYFSLLVLSLICNFNL